MNINLKTYNTVEYNNVIIKVSPELLQDIHAGTQPPSLLEDIVIKEYNKLIPIIRNNKLIQLGL